MTIDCLQLRPSCSSFADWDRLSRPATCFPRRKYEVCDFVQAGSFLDTGKYSWSISAHQLRVAFHYGQRCRDEVGNVDLRELIRVAIAK